MKVLHINATNEGGTFNLMFDIHKALIKKKIKTKIYLPQKKKASNFYFQENVLFYFHFYIINFLKKIIKKFFLKPAPYSTVTLSLFDSFGLKKMIKKIKPDIIHLHWLGNEFVSVRDIIDLKVPIVWTMHDLWIVNPYYHYKKPQNINFFSKILTNYLFNKIRIIIKKNIKIVPTSAWSKRSLEQKFKLDSNKCTYIPCGIDFKKFYPMSKLQCKKTLGLQKKPVILFIAFGVNNPRKGFEYLKKSLKFIKYDYQLLIAGDIKPLNFKGEYKFVKLPKTFKMRRLVFNSADLLIVPSTHEAFGLVSIEAAACNTPSVVFNGTGLEDPIKHKINGYVAKYKDSNDLGKGINWILKSIKEEPKKFEDCRKKAMKKYDINHLADKYILTYKKLLTKNFI
ncbi:glycosyltransferase [Candidatus Pelagibacter sp.]|nr:glycosyltransferase [Candidatus Pelagibacter sp.]